MKISCLLFDIKIQIFTSLMITSSASVEQKFLSKDITGKKLNVINFFIIAIIIFYLPEVLPAFDTLMDWQILKSLLACLDALKDIFVLNKYALGKKLITHRLYFNR